MWKKTSDTKVLSVLLHAYEVPGLTKLTYYRKKSEQCCLWGDRTKIDWVREWEHSGIMVMFSIFWGIEVAHIYAFVKTLQMWI